MVIYHPLDFFLKIYVKNFKEIIRKCIESYTFLRQIIYKIINISSTRFYQHRFADTSPSTWICPQEHVHKNWFKTFFILFTLRRVHQNMSIDSLSTKKIMSLKRYLQKNKIHCENVCCKLVHINYIHTRLIITFNLYILFFLFLKILICLINIIL